MQENQNPEENPVKQLILLRDTYRKATFEETKDWSRRKKRRIVARAMLQMRAVLPNELYDKLSTLLPDIDANMTVEELLTIRQIYKAIVDGDTLATNSLLDSAYGRVSTDESEVETVAVQAMTPERMKEFKEQFDKLY